MSDLRELYQQIIIDHGRRPRNFGALPDANHSKQGFNPLCGDQLTLYVVEKNNVIEDIHFKGEGCAISMASASLMTEHLKHKTFAEAEKIFKSFHQLVTQQQCTDETCASLGKLTILSGVAEFPARVKCATLAWHTLRAILQQDTSTISTESL